MTTGSVVPTVKGGTGVSALSDLVTTIDWIPVAASWTVNSSWVGGPGIVWWAKASQVVPPPHWPVVPPPPQVSGVVQVPQEMGGPPQTSGIVPQFWPFGQVVAGVQPQTPGVPGVPPPQVAGAVQVPQSSGEPP